MPTTTIAKLHNLQSMEAMTHIFLDKMTIILNWLQPHC